jgi:amidohydrolase
MDWVRDRVERLFSDLVEWRRDFHRNPELSFQEKRTSEKVADILEALGLKVKKGIAGYGVTGLLCGKGSGPTIALRADMDALPIQDEKDVEYRSQVPGVMHACGHDGHMAMLLGAASVLTERKEQLAGNVLFLFQPAEESLPGGAIGMIGEGVLDGVDAIYGLHLWSPMPFGTVGVREGGFMAAADSFELEIVGKGGHGALPHTSVDAVAVAAHVVVNLQTIISREVDPLEPAVISVGTIHGGNAFNVIAERVRLSGTVRSFNLETRERLIRRMEEVIDATCRMYGAKACFRYNRGYPPLVNHPAETRLAAQVAEEIVGPEQVRVIEPVMGGEDFAYYLEHRPGAFLFVGAGDESRGITAPHHHPRFDIDERALKVGTEWLVRIALSYIGGNSLAKKAVREAEASL